MEVGIGNFLFGTGKKVTKEIFPENSYPEINRITFSVNAPSTANDKFSYLYFPKHWIYHKIFIKNT